MASLRSLTPGIHRLLKKKMDCRVKPGNDENQLSRSLDYTDAVVTPPSITMVWPVMKVEASEAR